MLSLGAGTTRRCPARSSTRRSPAALLGYPAQIGYGALVAERLGQHAWQGPHAHRLVAPAAERGSAAYAADDVRYLVPLYRDLRDALERPGGLQWLYEDTRELEQPDLHRTEPEAAWRRLKVWIVCSRSSARRRNCSRMARSGRDQDDKPRGWILADDALREIAERLPASTRGLERIRSLPPAVVRKRGEEILALIEQARERGGERSRGIQPPRPDPQSWRWSPN